MSTTFILAYYDKMTTQILYSNYEFYIQCQEMKSYIYITSGYCPEVEKIGRQKRQDRIAKVTKLCLVVVYKTMCLSISCLINGEQNIIKYEQIYLTFYCQTTHFKKIYLYFIFPY